MPERDLFANFDRMRREMDELFGDVFSRAGLARRRGGFSPAVDVAYSSNPPRVIVTAELAGVQIEQLEIEIEGRQLILSGMRGAATVEGEVYQQVEIARGNFRRSLELGVEVQVGEAKASYEDGMLRIEIPLAQSQPSRTRTVPIEANDRP